MENNLYSIVKRIYIKEDLQFFKDKCNKKLDIIDSIISLAYPICYSIDYFEEDSEPSVEIYFTFKPYEGDILIEFQTILRISKITEIFVFQHEYSMDNPVTNKIAPVLDGFSSESYIKEQDLLEDTLSKFLFEKNYKKIMLQQLDEVIPNIKIPDKSLFGNQMTLEMALFRDVWGICE